MVSVALVCLLSGLQPVQASPLRVHVVLSERGGSYQEFGDALRDKLGSQPVILSFGGAGDKTDEVDLIVAVGMKAAAGLISSKAPVLNVLVPKAGYDKLASPAAGHNSSAIYLDQPLERQLSLLLSVLPKARHIGVLYSSPPPGIVNLRRLVAERKLLLHEKSVGKEHALAEALDEVLGESEVLLVLPDTNVYNPGTIRNILLTSYRKQVPLIGISQAYVKAGALCALYTTPVQIALQASEAIRSFANSGKLPPSQYPKEFEVSANLQVARSLDLTIKDADELREEIRRTP
jgi:ABC-type uncharacterized transport system substrate-binding protein